jgi:hypothetical protein
MCLSTMPWRLTWGLNNTHEICSECLMEIMLSIPLPKSPDLKLVCICSLVLRATTELRFCSSRMNHLNGLHIHKLKVIFDKRVNIKAR